MSELEKKFYNWLMLNYCVPIKPEKIAKDFAEIAEKEFDGRSFDTFLKLKEENTKLKKQIEEQDKEIVEYLQEPDRLLMKIDKLEKAIKESKTIIWRKPLEDWVSDFKATYGGDYKLEIFDEFLEFIEEASEPIEDEEIAEILEDNK